MSDASRLVSRLSAKGFVDVSQNPADKRLVNILVSDKGLTVVKAVDSSLTELDELLNGLTEEEATTLVRLLAKVRDSIKVSEEKNIELEQIEA